MLGIGKYKTLRQIEKNEQKIDKLKNAFSVSELCNTLSIPEKCHKDLQKLVQDGLVENNTQFYTLSPKGKEWLNNAKVRVQTIIISSVTSSITTALTMNLGKLFAFLTDMLYNVVKGWF